LGTTGYAPLASPTFTGTVTGPTINASTTLQIGGAAVTSTAAELNLLDNVSGLVQADLTKLAAVDASADELNILEALSRGSILYGNASGATTVLTKGSASQLLTSDGTDIAWTDPAPASTTVTDSTANTNFPVVFHNESNLLFDDTGALRYNPSTGELLVPKLTVAGTTTTVDTVTMNSANAIIFEGATADAYETTLSIMDPTADHTQYLINQTGYIPVLAASTTTAITSTPAELNALDGIPGGLTATELGYVDGVTSAIQTQIDTKSPTAGPTFTGTVTAPTINASTALQIGGAAVTSTAAELNLLDGLTDIGYKNVPQNSQSAAYTCVLADSGKHIHHPSTDAYARTFTLPAHSSVAYPIGTAITFTNMTSQDVTIAITSDTMYLAKDGTTGNRTLGQWGMATALKVDSTKWLISGNGLT
jgi:hypothetical protein